MRSKLRRALLVSLALASTAFACTTFDSDPVPAEGGVPDGAPTPSPDGATSDATGPDLPDGDTRLALCQRIDARACLDFEPGSPGRGLKTTITNVDLELRDGGAQDSMVSQHVSTKADAASGYELGAILDVPFAMSLDVLIRSLTETGAGMYVVNIGSPSGATRVYLNARRTAGATFALEAEVAGVLDGGQTASTTTGIASNLRLDRWLNVHAVVTSQQISFSIDGQSSVDVMLDPQLARFGRATKFSAGPASARERFDVRIDNVVVP